ncbi:unnamed protein product, partial [Owenia fusiformis]
YSTLFDEVRQRPIDMKMKNRLQLVAFDKTAQKFFCKVCQKSFTNRSTLLDHIKLHTGENLLSCSFCDVYYTMFDEMRKIPIHIKMKNRLQLVAFDETTQKFFCKVCQKSFTNRGSLLNHTRLHTGENLHNCSFCGKQFTKNSQLVSHERTHTGEKPFKCNICLKSFGDPSPLTRHMKTYHLKQ